MSADANVIINVDDSELEAVLEKLELLVQNKSGKQVVVDMEKGVDDFVRGSGREVRELDIVARRLLSQIQGLREVYQLQRVYKQLKAGNVLLGSMNAVFFASQVLSQVKAYLDELDRQRRDMEVFVREAKGFGSRVDYVGWQSEQRSAITNVNR